MGRFDSVTPPPVCWSRGHPFLVFFPDATSEYLMALAAKDVAEIFEEAGLHPSVLFTVNRIEIADYTAAIDITLRYFKSKPVCCPEPGCYIPALRPRGMDLVLTRIQERSRRLVLDLRLGVHREYEAGYQFLDGFFEANDEAITYSYP